MYELRGGFGGGWDTSWRLSEVMPPAGRTGHTLAIENLLNRDYAEPDSLVILNPQGVPTFVKEPSISVLAGVDARF